MAAKRKRGNSWEYVIRRKGVLDKPIYLTCRDEAEGDARAAKLERMLDAGVVPDELRSRSAVSSVGSLVAEYLRAVVVSRDDSLLLGVQHERLGATRLTAVDYGWCESWVSSMKRDFNLAPGTIRHHVGALARCFDWAVSSQHLAGNPLRSLPKRYAVYSSADAAVSGRRVDVHRDRRLLPGEHEQIQGVLQGAVPDGRQRGLDLVHGYAALHLYELALSTGMRLRELYCLSWDRVDFGRRTVFLEKTKSGKRRQVPLSSVAIRVLEEVGRNPGGLGLVFPFWNGDDADLRGCTSRLSRLFGRAFAAAGCQGLRFHDIRHEATCRFYENTDLSDVEIARILGWSNLSMALRYANLRGSDLADRLG